MMTTKIRKPLAIIAAVALTLLLAVSTATPAFAEETADTTTDSNLQIVYDEPDLGESNTSDNYITLPDAPAKEGYTFRGWRVNGSSDLYKTGDVVVKDGSEEIHLQPVYEQVELGIEESLQETPASENNDLNFSSQYDSPIEIERDHDSILIAPEAKEKDGYAFYGWSKNAETPLYRAGERIAIKAGEKVVLYPVYVYSQKANSFADIVSKIAAICLVAAFASIPLTAITKNDIFGEVGVILFIAAIISIPVVLFGYMSLNADPLSEALQRLQYMTP